MNEKELRWRKNIEAALPSSLSCV